MSDHEKLLDVAQRWERLAAELKAENARLREKNDRQVVYGQRALDVAEEVVALREALQALVDACDDLVVTWAYGGNGEGWNFGDRIAELRASMAAAVALLAKGEPQ